MIVMLDSSDNFSDEDFEQMKEGLAGLVDETFDLSPDVVRVGFVVYTSVTFYPLFDVHEANFQ